MSVGDPAWTQSAADHVTERESGAWIDCVPAAGLELVRSGANDRTIPATAEEREALRAAMGLPPVHPGATLAQLATGIEARYGLTGFRLVRDWAALAAHVARPSTVAVVTGSMGELPPHFRRYDPGFTGSHAVAVYGQGATALPWWCDPLAPVGAYRGEPISTSALRAYFDGYAGAGALLADIGGLTRSEMAIAYALTRWRVPAGTKFYDAPGGRQIGSMSAEADVTAFGVPLDRSADGLDYAWRAVLVRTAAMTGRLAPKLVYMSRTDLVDELATVPEWDTFAWAALTDPDSWKQTTSTVTLAVEGAVVATVEV